MQNLIFTKMHYIFFSWLFLPFVKFMLNFNPIIQCALNSFCIGAPSRSNRLMKFTIMITNANTVILQGNSDLREATFHLSFISDSILSIIFYNRFTYE